MDSYTIFVFEGEKTEVQIFNRLKDLYLDNITNQVAISSFRTSLYELHRRLKQDEEETLFWLLKNDFRNEQLADIQPSQVSEIYLFFDYDGHIPGATFEKVEELLEMFDDETDQGKLYISYPMVESLKHLNSNVHFKDLVAKSEKAYKVISERERSPYTGFKDFSRSQWASAIEMHCQKLNYLMHKQFSPPTDYFPQTDIYLKQKNDYISPSGKVAVLSAFPVFLIDYFGTKKYEELTTQPILE